jgi:hypothetical protein
MISGNLQDEYDPQAWIDNIGTAGTHPTFFLNEPRSLSKFAGAGAHHLNGIAERSIWMVISIARAMMMHSAIHWPEVSDPSLWPMAVQHAALYAIEYLILTLVYVPLIFSTGTLD